MFVDAPRAPKVVDRRANPVNGYRAVHVVVFPEGVPIEIQIRTELQHEWAKLFERLADLVGRDIRYGEPPAQWLSAEERDALDADTSELYELVYMTRAAVVTSALALADNIAGVETVELAAPQASALAQLRRTVTPGLAGLQTFIETLETVEVRAEPFFRPPG